MMSREAKRVCEIAHRHGLTVAWSEEMENRSTLAGNEVTIGVYDDDELMLISFFHEVGHSLDKRPPPVGTWVSKIDFEAEAWVLGLKLARDEGVTFSPAAHLWAIEQLRTYIDGAEADATFYEMRQRQRTFSMKLECLLFETAAAKMPTERTRALFVNVYDALFGERAPWAQRLAWAAQYIVDDLRA